MGCGRPADPISSGTLRGGYRSSHAAPGCCRGTKGNHCRRPGGSAGRVLCNFGRCRLLPEGSSQACAWEHPNGTPTNQPAPSPVLASFRSDKPSMQGRSGFQVAAAGMPPQVPIVIPYWEGDRAKRGSMSLAVLSSSAAAPSGLERCRRFVAWSRAAVAPRLWSGAAVRRSASNRWRRHRVEEEVR